MSKVNQEVAEQDIKRWLDARNTSDKKRESLTDQIKELVGYVMEGRLYINEASQLVQKLDFPFGEEAIVSELKYKNRISVGDIHKRMTGNNVKSGDIDGRLMVYACALTGLAFNQVALMDSTDYSVTSTVASFFF
jgi:hypothetical protein